MGSREDAEDRFDLLLEGAHGERLHQVVVDPELHGPLHQLTIGADVVGTQGTPVEIMGRLIHHSFAPELWDVRNELTRMNLPE